MLNWYKDYKWGWELNSIRTESTISGLPSFAQSHHLVNTIHFLAFMSLVRDVNFWHM